MLDNIGHCDMNLRLNIEMKTTFIGNDVFAYIFLNFASGFDYFATITLIRVLSEKYRELFRLGVRNREQRLCVFHIGIVFKFID